VLLVAVTALCGRLAWVRAETGEAGLTPSPAPPKVHLADRDYLRATGGLPLPATAREVGTTSGGGAILSEPMPRVPDAVPVVVWVRDGAAVAQYSLSGGP
jgi:hypothetical protein